MNIVSRCVQDIVKYGNECKGMIGLVVMTICLGAVGIWIYCRKKGIECLPASRFFYRLFICVCNGAYWNIGIAFLLQNEKGKTGGFRSACH